MNNLSSLSKIQYANIISLIIFTPFTSLTGPFHQSSFAIWLVLVLILNDDQVIYR